MFITDEQYAIAEQIGVSKINVNQRVRLYGWTIRKAITEPLNTEMVSTEKEFFGGAV